MWAKIDNKDPEYLPEEEDEDDDTATTTTIASQTEIWTAFTQGEGDNLYNNNAQDFVHNRRMLCAISYLIQHHIPEGMMSRLHRHLSQPSKLYDGVARTTNNFCKHWQNEILTNYAVTKAKQIFKKTEDVGIDIFTQSETERKAIIIQEWNERETIYMYAYLARYIDFRSIFHPSESAKAAVAPLRNWLKYTFYLAINDTIKLRLAGAKQSPQEARIKDREAFKRWRNVSGNRAMPPKPSMAKIPIKLQRTNQIARQTEQSDEGVVSVPFPTPRMANEPP